MAERNPLAGRAWKALTEEEREEYKKKSKNMKEIDLNTIEDSQRHKIIRTARLQIMDQLEVLNNLGCHSMLLLVDTADGKIDGLGSEEGLQFLSSNVDIQLKFRQYLACDIKVYSPKDISNLFNQKYSEATGKQNSKVPYQKGNFKVHNLPEGIPFQRPYAYGRKQRSLIMEAKDCIRFEILNDDVQNLHSNEEVSQIVDGEVKTGADGDTNLQPPQISKEDFKVFLKLVDGEVLSAADVERKIGEKDVAVDLVLDQDERLKVQSSPALSLFDGDALRAIEGNMSHSEEEGVVIPVFSDETEQKFWLFYGYISPRSLSRISDDEKVEGLWLDIMAKDESSTKYKLLTKHPDSIDGLNIVKSKIGPLYFCQKLALRKNTIFEMPGGFYNAIMKVINLYWF
ncbi:uncharacterized protein LOC110231675 [Exaiptasia diaphana]|uniref:Uncharacterized protein n=1 Tax=Exaiptasia diaphana TaxID=2652724 RepID=A0A913YDS5_EXADI|nr:uncharacterized protein LOC110231675 [Exaiptasia diaphana]